MTGEHRSRAFNNLVLPRAVADHGVRPLRGANPDLHLHHANDGVHRRRGGGEHYPASPVDRPVCHRDSEEWIGHEVQTRVPSRAAGARRAGSAGDGAGDGRRPGGVVLPPPGIIGAAFAIGVAVGVPSARAGLGRLLGDGAQPRAALNVRLPHPRLALIEAGAPRADDARRRPLLARAPVTSPTPPARRCPGGVREGTPPPFLAFPLAGHPAWTGKHSAVRTFCPVAVTNQWHVSACRKAENEPNGSRVKKKTVHHRYFEAAPPF